MHIPQPKIYDLAETSTFGIFRGRNVRGRNVRAEMSVAEMSYIRLCQSTNVIFSLKNILGFNDINESTPSLIA